MNSIELVADYPANVAGALQRGDIDMALLPVAAIPTIPNAQVITDYGIASDGNVVSVCIFSMVPMEQIETCLLYTSRCV